MVFDETPEPTTNFMPGMFELQEEIVERARRASDQPWVGAVGPEEPPLPREAPSR